MEVEVQGVESNRGEGRGWPCSRRPIPTSPTQPRLPPPTRCTRAARTLTEELTSTTTTTPTLTPTLTHNPPTSPHPQCPRTTNTMPTSTRMEGVALPLEGPLPPAARRRCGTLFMRR